ncbi:hypothetical protein N8865_00555 [Francisellaceae bacterium]|nr:hypothetical protein [Francisellaceae bacterium]MDA7742086.1 hypothetical protein [Francisellaceae bacterium]
MRRVNATELSKMTFCEQKLVYEDKKPNFKPKFSNRANKKAYKKKEASHKIRVKQGNQIHENHQKYNMAKDKRCFIASCIYGEDAWQTELLRQYRDERMAKAWHGRLFIKCYYSISPIAVKIIERVQPLKNVVKIALNKIVRCLSK